MKRWMMILLTVGLLLCGCSSDITPINSYWGESVEETLAGFGLAVEDAVIEESEGNGYVLYTFPDVKILGQKCELRMEFTGYGDGEPTYSGCFFVCDSESKANKLYEKLTNMDSCVEIGETVGFGTLSDLTEEQIAWFEKYTAFVAGEKGFMLADTMPQVQEDGTKVRVKVNSLSDEMPLVELKLMNNEEIHMVRMIDYVHHMWSCRDAQEKTHPNGIPMSDELQQRLEQER